MFRDETGARPSVVGPFLADLLDVPPPAIPGNAPPDEALWHRLVGNHYDTGELVRTPSGPLLNEPGDHTAIEVRTESELIALHALSEIAIRSASDGLSERSQSAARWHLAEIQPDNATNHPWAIQVFIRMSLDESCDVADAARIHAQTMLHNCQISLGRPDRLSACILLHAARSLERAP